MAQGWQVMSQGEPAKPRLLCFFVGGLNACRTTRRRASSTTCCVSGVTVATPSTVRVDFPVAVVRAVVRGDDPAEVPAPSLIGWMRAAAEPLLAGGDSLGLGLVI